MGRHRSAAADGLPSRGSGHSGDGPWHTTVSTLRLCAKDLVGLQGSLPRYNEAFSLFLRVRSLLDLGSLVDGSRLAEARLFVSVLDLAVRAQHESILIRSLRLPSIVCNPVLCGREIDNFYCYDKNYLKRRTVCGMVAPPSEGNQHNDGLVPILLGWSRQGD